LEDGVKGWGEGGRHGIPWLLAGGRNVSPRGAGPRIEWEKYSTFERK
jgi:hypothetical protein